MADNLLQGLQAAANATSQTGVSFLLTTFLLNSSVRVRTFGNVMVQYGHGIKALQYFEQLKNSPDGWKLCCDALIRNRYRYFKFDIKVNCFCVIFWTLIY